MASLSLLSVRALSTAAVFWALVVSSSDRGVLAEQVTPASGVPPPPAITWPLDLRENVLLADSAVHEGTPYEAFFDGRQVRIVLAVDQGMIGNVTAALTKAGGWVEVNQEDVGYVRAMIPFRSWSTIRSGRGVVAANLDGPVLLFSHERSPEPQPRDPGPARVNPSAADANARRDTPAMEPYVVRRTISHEVLGLSRLWETHPTFDGRGIGIAIVEPGASTTAFTHAAFRTAWDLRGRVTPKVADIIPPASSWRRVPSEMSFTAREPLASVLRGAARLPRAGTFHWGRVTLPSGPSSVLWDPQTREIWLDADRNLDHSNDKPLMDVRSDATSAIVLEGVGRLYATQSRDAREVLLHVETSSHAAMAASVAAAAERDGIAGTAPAARLVFIDRADTTAGEAPLGTSAASSMIEAVLAAARHPDVDIISISATGIADWPSAGKDVLSVLVHRIVSRYEKPIVKSAANDRSLGMAETFGDAALSVGAFAPSLASRRYRGAPASPDGMQYSSRGPRRDGAALPDLLGPVGEPAAAVCTSPSPNDRRARFVKLPDCYQLSSATSAAAPSIAGLVAVLLSGARQQQLRPTVAELYRALRASAKPLPGISVAAQGAGVPQADVAWQLLSRAGPPAPRIATQGSIVHGLDRYLVTQRRGPGLYEREGWRAGQRGRRSLVLRREDGPALVRYDLHLQGDVGTFSAPRQIVTRRGEDVVVPIDVHPMRSGIHVARLLVRDPSKGDIVAVRQLTIVAADDLPRAASTSRSYSGRLAPQAVHDIAVRVLPGAELLRLSHEDTMKVRLAIQDPSGLVYGRHDVSGLRWSGPNASVMLIPQPAPGTWIMSLARSGEELAIAAEDPTYTIEVAAVDIDARMLPADSDRRMLRVNIKGPDDIRLVPHLARTIRTSSRIDADSPATLPFVIEPSATVAQWSINVDGPEGVHAYLYDCSSGFCVRRHSASPASSTHLLTVDRPAAGRWVLAMTGGPRATLPQVVTVDVSVASAALSQKVSPPAADKGETRNGDERTTILPIDCAAADDNLSVLLQFALVPSTPEWKLESKAAAGILAPAMPPVGVPTCGGGVTASPTQAARPR